MIDVKFNEMIEKFMPYVESGSKEPFMIYRDEHGSWHCDHTQNQYGDTFDWVEEIKDPYAVTVTGYDMAKGSFPYVYDRILNERLRTEYENAVFTNTDLNELKALINLVEENIGEFSSEVTDYLTQFDRPLDALYRMTPMSLVSDDPDLDYEPDVIGEFVGAVEDEVYSRLNKRTVFEIPVGDEQLPPIPQKPQPNIANNPTLDGYTELNKISINKSEIILSENPNAEHRYMVVENRYTPYYNDSGENNIYTGHTSDYLEAINEFTKRVQYNINCVQSDRNLLKSMNGVDYVELKNNDCLPGSDNEDFTGKLIIVKAEELKPEYRSSENQLVNCTHGNGARPNAKGTSVFCKELLSGDSVCYGRHQIAGIADPDKLPEWAKLKLSPPEKQQAQPKQPPQSKEPPSLLGEVREAAQLIEQRRAERGNNPATTKKHDGQEV